jgi:4-carboxymuconolactone decarboxylase
VDERERYGRGLARRRAVLGSAHVDRSLARRTELTTEFQDLISRYAWGEIWTRPGLDPRTRRCMTLAMMLALGHWEELAMHLRAACVGGNEGALTREEVKEVLLQAAIYCGVPAANHGFKIAEDVFAELDRQGGVTPA